MLPLFLGPQLCVISVDGIRFCLKNTSRKVKFNETCIICSICYSDIWHYAEKLLAWHCPTMVVVYLVHLDLPDPHVQIVHIPLHILHILGVQQGPCIMT